MSNRGCVAPPVESSIDNSVGTLMVALTRTRLLRRNLLSNADCHAANASTPALLFLRRRADGRLALGLRGHVPGVAPSALPQLAEAFYGPDAASGHACGDVGLRLYLARLVAQAHGGGLRIRLPDPGLEVAMVRPAQSPTCHRPDTGLPPA